jgi:hypothetical protein
MAMEPMFDTHRVVGEGHGPNHLVALNVRGDGFFPHGAHAGLFGDRHDGVTTEPDAITRAGFAGNGMELGSLCPFRSQQVMVAKVREKLVLRRDQALGFLNGGVPCR